MPAGAVRGIGANSQFARALKNAADEAIAADAQKVADDAAHQADLLVSKLFVTHRTGDRRRPGRHLLGSFRGTVALHRGARIPVVITLRSSAPAVKVNSLNYGSSPHVIGAGGPRGGGILAFPRTGNNEFDNARSNARQARRTKAQAGVGGKRYTSNQVVVPVVDHPGTIGKHFMEQALETAASRAYHTAVRIPRR